MKEVLTFDAPKHKSSIIKVLGVGGGGSNAVTHMYKQGIKGVDFIICNTDSQAMDMSPIPNKIQLGDKGLGAGSLPDVGRDAAEENIQDIKDFLESNTKMLFITAGMGGGTGTGAAPVIAKVAREMGVLTVAIVTIPFMFEGRKRRLQAEKGLEELRNNVDTLLIISNEKLREIHGNLKLSEAFGKADDILTTAAKGIAEIITVTGYINVDFEDVKTVMHNSGTAIMGSAVAEGDDRARIAVSEALTSPLLNDNKIKGASDILLYISSGKDEITFDEVTEITDFIQREAGLSAEIIWGNGFDESLEDKISITLIATGFESPEDIEVSNQSKPAKKTVYTLGDKLPEKNEPEEKKVDELKPVVEEPESSISEITLIRKDRPADNTTPPEPEIVEEKKEILLFDFKSESRKEKTPVNEKLQLDEVSIPINNSIEQNQRLKIGYTVGGFEHQTKHDTVPGKHEMQKKADDRVKKLRDLSIQVEKPAEDLDHLENVPAYVRKNIRLNPVAPASESVVARYTLSEDGEENSNIKSGENTYLFNKPD